MIRTAELLLVARQGPLALLDHLLDRLADLGAGGNDVASSELVERTRTLDVAQGLLEILKLGLDLRSASLGLLNLYTMCATKQISTSSACKEAR